MNNDVIDNDTGEYLPTEVQEISGAVAAEISQQVATAKRYPRRSDKAISTEIMSRATLDEETAAECCYSLPRAGKDIVGPSVRFAELVFASYGNMRAGARFVEIDTKDPLRSAVIIEGVCIDMQMNNGQTVPVRRSITGKKGVFNADMTNIAFSAGAAIARREAILKTVPKSIWGAAWKGVLAVLQGDQKTLAARRRSSIEAFAKMGVEAERVFAALDVTGEEAITLEHMPRLIGMWTALRDGTETIDSLFKPAGPAHDVVKNPLKDDPGIQTDGNGMITQGHHRAAAMRGNAEELSRAEKVVAADGTVLKDRNGSETASDQVEKSDNVTGPAGNATDNGAAGPAQDSGQGAKTAQASPAGPAKAEKPYTDGEGYMSWMRDQLDVAKTKAGITELWGASRADRSDMLDPDQIEELTKYKATKLEKLKGGA